MRNAITHPTHREVKMIEGLYGRGKKGEIRSREFSTEGLEVLISMKLALSIRKPSVSLESLE